MTREGAVDHECPKCGGIAESAGDGCNLCGYGYMDDDPDLPVVVRSRVSFLSLRNRPSMKYRLAGGHDPWPFFTFERYPGVECFMLNARDPEPVGNGEEWDGSRLDFIVQNPEAIIPRRFIQAMRARGVTCVAIDFEGKEV